MNNENTQYDDKRNYAADEATQLDSHGAGKAGADEATQFDDSRFPEDEATRLDGQTQAAPAQPQKRSMGKRVAIAFGASAALGAGAAALMSATPADSTDDDDDIVSPDHPEWTDGQVAVATTVDDSMSFGEAFNAARDEVGAGGVFEWHGYIYSTYTAEEWDAMSQEERDEYGSHFSWQGGATNTTAAADPTASQTGSGSSAATASTATTPQGEGPDYTAGAHEGQAEVVAVSDDDIDDSGIEVLGVQHDSESGMTYASITMGGHDAVLVDIDSDDTFEVLAVDANDDHQISDNEMIDISGDNITAQGLGIDTGHANGTGTMMAYDDPGTEPGSLNVSPMDTGSDINVIDDSSVVTI